MKFGQDVYWGDGGWRAQIMGVVGGKRVAGLGGLGEWAGNRRIDGRRRGGCGPGMPGPYRGGGRARGCWPGTGRRRGQDPSLRCGRLEGGYGKACGPGMPGPYGVVRD